MNLFSFFFPKRHHTEVRYVVGSKRERTVAQQKQQSLSTSVRCQLAVYAATTTLAQRKQDTEDYFRAAALRREMGRG